MTKLSREEVDTIIESLTDFHAVFYTFLQLAAVEYSEGAPILTAAVYLSEVKARLVLNKDFWQQLSQEERLFVICHECLHVLLDHGFRNAKEHPKATPQLVNIAQDITINEMIVDLFGFKREQLSDWKKFCWIDTCFKHPQFVAQNKNFYYYLEKLVVEDEQNTASGAPSAFPQTVDQHGDSTVKSAAEVKGSCAEANPILDALLSELSEDELGRLQQAAGVDVTKKGPHGTAMSSLQRALELKKSTVKLKFNSIIRGLKRRASKTSFSERDSFALTARRYEMLTRSGMILPGQHSGKKAIKMLNAAIFIDVSGSCADLIDSFNNVRAAFDAEKATFKLQTFTFDTICRPLPEGRSVEIGYGGGTSFQIIEAECLKLPTYPDCVIVLTDGVSDKPSPKHADRWIWLLSEDGTDKYLDKSHRIFRINKITF